MIVLVCGSRDSDDVSFVWRTLDDLDEMRRIDMVIDGGASGVDRIARRWAVHRDRRSEIFPADWQRHGAAAGPIRNAAMLNHGKPDLVIAFPGGKGTADMVRKARAAGVEVLEVKP